MRRLFRRRRPLLDPTLFNAPVEIAGQQYRLVQTMWTSDGQLTMEFLTESAWRRRCEVRLV